MERISTRLGIYLRLFSNHPGYFRKRFSEFGQKKVIVSQRNVNQISYISILQFGENYGLGHKGEMGFSLNRSLNTHVIKILRLFNLWELAFWFFTIFVEISVGIFLLLFCPIGPWNWKKNWFSISDFRCSYATEKYYQTCQNVFN